uniref:MAPK/MAK/MRK overlapping kinase n=1 Tax=Ciona intestinalis TaxID=7719 RepID=UPI000EF46D72|nr:MAPK/MAK/MRK overlapping kinase [Ciona intestinalis]|eukprot:XP_026692109.1 MAPK/MAK/MRK overlapping kinase [Ciona intestinalis]
MHKRTKSQSNLTMDSGMQGRLRLDTLSPFSPEYRILGKKGEGTFSEVLKCQHVKDGTYYACKKMKQHYDGVDQVNNLREIQAMRRLNPHANIIGLHEIIYDKKTGTVALICELMDMNIYELIRGRRHYVPEPKVKSFMYQLLKSLDHMHRCGIFHRDVKPENILIKDDVLKLADFGSCRSVYSKQPYTEYISTRWYRAPECLLTDGYYTYRMDLWSVGCVLFEVMSLHPLFPGANEVDQISKIHDVLGTPDASILNKMKHRNRGINFDFPQKKGTGIEKLLPHASQQCIELIYKMCTYDPDERITAKQALRHPYFRDIREAEKRAQEAQQMSRYNEAGSVKGGPGSNAGDVPVWKQNQIQKKRRRQRRLVEQHQTHHQTLGGIGVHGNSTTNAQGALPQLVPVNGTALHGNSTFGGNSKPVFPSTTLPKVHLPHHHQPTTNSLLPGILKANMMQPKALHKPKIKPSEPTKSMYGHYQLPSINRHIYHH